jgi:hypothetical protein
MPITASSDLQGPCRGSRRLTVCLPQNLSCGLCRYHLPVDGGSPFAGYFGGRLARFYFGRRPCRCYKLILILLFTNFLTITLPCKRFFHAFLLTWFQIKRVTLDFLDDVFGLHLALEAPQGVLKGFALLYSNLCQEKYTSKQSQSGYPLEYAERAVIGIQIVSNISPLRLNNSKSAFSPLG